MAVVVDCVLALMVVLGSLTITWGVRRFSLSTRVLALAFAFTAASWLAFLITTIGLTVRLLALPTV